MNAAEIGKALKGKKYGRQWKVCCPAHDDKSPSCIVFDGRESVQVRCMSGCAPIEIIAALRSRGLWEGRASDTDRAGQTQTVPKVSHETEALAMRDRARRIFDDAILCHGTIAQRYLESREIWSVAREIEDVRYHPECPREKRTQPAIVVAMRRLRVPGIQAIQRIFLTDEARKDGTMMMGPVNQAAMMLGGVCPVSVPMVLNVAEGFESGLSVRMMDNYPTWALGSAGAIERFAEINEVEVLQIWGDHDAAGIKAVRVCAERWHVRGTEVRTHVPEREGWDPADVWRDRCARQ